MVYPNSDDFERLFGCVWMYWQKALSCWRQGIRKVKHHSHCRSLWRQLCISLPTQTLVKWMLYRFGFQCTMSSQQNYLLNQYKSRQHNWRWNSIPFVSPKLSLPRVQQPSPLTMDQCWHTRANEWILLLIWCSHLSYSWQDASERTPLRCSTEPSWCIPTWSHPAPCWADKATNAIVYWVVTVVLA